MRVFEVQDGIKVSFYSLEEYKATLGGSITGEFVAAMECYIFHYEDAQDEPLEGLEGVWISEGEQVPEALGRVATELLDIPADDMVIDAEKGVVLLRRWPPELFQTTPLTLEDVREI